MKFSINSEAPQPSIVKIKRVDVLGVLCRGWMEEAEIGEFDGINVVYDHCAY